MDGDYQLRQIHCEGSELMPFYRGDGVEEFMEGPTITIPLEALFPREKFKSLPKGKLKTVAFTEHSITVEWVPDKEQANA
jgi:hypothetical protein